MTGRMHCSAESKAGPHHRSALSVTVNFWSNIQGIYPCGEGAGYAGGITSAAMDGIKVAETISKKYQKFIKLGESVHLPSFMLEYRLQICPSAFKRAV